MYFFSFSHKRNVKKKKPYLSLLFIIIHVRSLGVSTGAKFPDLYSDLVCATSILPSLIILFCHRPATIIHQPAAWYSKVCLPLPPYARAREGGAAAAAAAGYHSLRDRNMEYQWFCTSIIVFV